MGTYSCIPEKVKQKESLNAFKDAIKEMATKKLPM